MIPHGTQTGYGWHQCRCHDCREAARAYRAKRAGRIVERRLSTDEIIRRRKEADRSWMGVAACKGKDQSLWFPSTGMSADAAIARKVCLSCPVIQQCADYAEYCRESYGIWGGRGERERREIRRRNPPSR